MVTLIMKWGSVMGTKMRTKKGMDELVHNAYLDVTKSKTQASVPSFSMIFIYMNRVFFILWPLN